MGIEQLRVSSVFPVSVERLYRAWLDSDEHSKFTGGKAATIDPTRGGKFSACDGSIEGETIELDPDGLIVQTWRSTEFPVDHPPSTIEIVFEPEPEGTRLTIFHTEIPEGQASTYEEGWEARYFVPMRRYFGAPPKPKAKAAVGGPKKNKKESAKKAPTKAPAKPKVAAKKAAAKKPVAKKVAAKKVAKKPAVKKLAVKKPKGGVKANTPTKSPPKKKSAAKRSK